MTMMMVFSGWHICTACQKDSFYMCYTCPYSVCKRCVRSSEYVVVRENKGFCGICMKTIMLIENAAEANKEKVRESFSILLLSLIRSALERNLWKYLEPGIHLRGFLLRRHFCF